MTSRAIVVALLGTCVLLGGCFSSRSASSGDTHRKAIVDRQEPDLDKVLERLEALEERLEAASTTAGGRGAYAESAPSISGWGSQPSILQQLHQAREALAEARAEVERQQLAVEQLNQEVTSQAVRIEGLRSKEERLHRAIDEREVALQERDTLALRLQEADQALAASELDRLRAERELFNLIHDVLSLRPGQTQELLNLQDQLRERARTLEPVDLAADVAGAQ